EPKLDRPPKAEFGDYSSNIAMLTAPLVGEQPRQVAEKLGTIVTEQLGDSLERVEGAGPGLLDLFMSHVWLRRALGAGAAAGGGRQVRLRHAPGRRARPRRVRVRQPDRPGHRAHRPPRGLRRLAVPDP